MKSMTGFGKSSYQDTHYQIECEIKTVNQRFLDIQTKLPKELSAYELALRQVIKERLSRGRVELFVTFTKSGTNQKEVMIHWETVQPLLDNMQHYLTEKYGEITFDPVASVNQLLNNETYVEVKELNVADEHLESQLISMVKAALTAVENSRQQEGVKICTVLQQNCLELQQTVTELASFVAIYEKDFKDRFEAKLKMWLGQQVDETRLLTEMAILLEKGDIHEEIDRLIIHIEKAQELFLTEKPVGRELDFLIQEMNREVNTIGSKSSPILIKNSVIAMKTTLEKLREQIQNIE